MCEQVTIIGYGFLNQLLSVAYYAKQKQMWITRQFNIQVKTAQKSY